MMQVIEWAQFRTKEGVSEEQVHAEARKAQTGSLFSQAI